MSEERESPNDQMKVEGRKNKGGQLSVSCHKKWVILHVY